MMFDISQLNEMLLPELKEVAEKMKISGYKRMNKQDLIYRILDEQAMVQKNKTDSKESLVEPSVAKASAKYNRDAGLKEESPLPKPDQPSPASERLCLICSDTICRECLFVTFVPVAEPSALRLPQEVLNGSFLWKKNLKW